MATKDILMDGDKVCIAWFKKKIKKYILTTQAEPPEGGIVTGAGTYDEGTVVTVEAIPNEGYEFDHWDNDLALFGLGMGIFCSVDPLIFDGYVDTLLANGINNLRVDIPDYQSTWVDMYSKPAVRRAVAKGVKVIWGVSSNAFNNAAYIITAANWPTFRQAILDAAQWAQDNGVYEFQIGNEEEGHNDSTTLIDAQLRDNLKSVATEVKTIFTRGKISYSCRALDVDDWISLGKGDIDILAINIYRGNPSDTNWETLITNSVNKFGVDGTYITEFNLHPNSLNDYSTDEQVQAEALTEMIEYIKASGIKRAVYFVWESDRHGVVKRDGTYRQLLWDSLLNSR